MTDSLRSIAQIAILSGIMTMLSSCSKNKKYLHYIISLVVIFTLISPIYNIINTFQIKDAVLKDTSIRSDITYNQAIELAIEQDFVQKFKLSEGAISVKITDEASNEIKSISVQINCNEYFRYAERFKLYAQSQYGCEVEIIQNFGEQ